ncbi:hypothetical protein HERIO_1275 [Hepatospora eriocheir]|uniref:Uncharacterized protein n=1 Tax=Hepatospora eriocheir TaxID=1081669 RepID=A0A1X0QAI8_9MICR|nr:hypothetical protein HERIO_1275 [Hepatospora eriocheir]
MEESSIDVENSKVEAKQLKFATPILQKHVELAVFKLKTLIKNKEKGIFDNVKFNIQIKSIQYHLKFTIKAMGGKLVEK